MYFMGLGRVKKTSIGVQGSERVLNVMKGTQASAGNPDAQVRGPPPGHRTKDRVVRIRHSMTSAQIISESVFLCFIILGVK